MRHCVLILMLYCPSLSPASASSRLLGSWARSRKEVAASRMPQPLFRLFPERLELRHPFAFGEALRFLILVASDHLPVYQKNTLYVQRKYKGIFFSGQGKT